ASGCALVIPLLAQLDAPSAALIAAAIAALSSWAFFAAAGQRALRAPIAAAVLACAGLVNAHAHHPPLRPAWVKGGREAINAFLYSRWNTYSRVTVEPTVNG